jgi:hypothetical protein
MKNWLMISLLLAGTVASAEFNTIERPFECPLRVQRPTLGNPGFDIEIEALTFFLEEESPGICKKWIEKVRQVRDRLVLFHEKTINPLPADLVKETEALSDSVAGILLESVGALRAGNNPCSQSKLTEQAKDALVGLVRTLYASNENLRRTARASGAVLKVTQSVEEAVSSAMKAIKEQLAFNEKKAKQRAEEFTNKACEWLEMENEVRCKKRAAPNNYQAKLEAVRKQIKRQVDIVAASTREFLSNQTLFERIKKLGKRPQIETGAEAFYQYVVPALRMCEIEQALVAHEDPPENQSKEFLARCGHLLCDNVGMLPRVGSPVVQRSNFETAFCDFAGDYRRVEAMYRQGFDEASAAHSQRPDQPLGGPFCPSQGKVTNLPPMNDSQKPRANAPGHAAGFPFRKLR